MVMLIFLLLLLTLVFPYLRIMVAGAPIYFAYPVVFLLILTIPKRIHYVGAVMSRMRVWFWLFLLAILLSMAHQMLRVRGPRFSIYAMLQRYLTILALPALIGIWAVKRGLFRKTVSIWSVLIAVVAIWAILQVILPDVMDTVDRIYYFKLARITATEELQGRAEYATSRGIAGAWNANVAGPILLISFPVLFAGLHTRRLRTVLMMLVVLGGIVATGSRQSMIGLVWVFLVLLWPERRRLRALTHVRWAVPVFLGTVALGVTMAVVFGFGSAQLARLSLDRLWSGVLARWDNYSVFVSVAVRSPVRLILGGGPDAAAVAGRVGNWAWGQGYVSNSWLLLIFDFGVLGFAGFLGMFLAAWRTCGARWIRASLAALAWVMMCDNAMHATYFCQAMVSLCLAMAIFVGFEVREQLEAEPLAMDDLYDEPPTPLGWSPT